MLKHQSNARDVAGALGRVERQIPYVTSLALNRTAAAIHKAIKEEIPRVFDRPTPYTMRALRIVRATKDSLSARVDFKDGGGRGTSADKYLGPQVYGGGRSKKRFERALGRVGPSGYYVPAAGAEKDAYGNMSRGQLVKLLSYLQAFGEQGYRANATARTRGRTEKMTGPQFKGRKRSQYVTINGVKYFVSHGKGSMSGNRQQTLLAGVWQKTGTHGVSVKPVLLAVDDPNYTPRLPFYETAEQVYGERFNREYSQALEEALTTAR